MLTFGPGRSLRFDVKTLATDVSSLRTDVSSIHSDVKALNPVLTEVKFQKNTANDAWEYLALRGSNGVVHELREHLSGNELPLTLYLDSGFTWTIVANGLYQDALGYGLTIDDEPSTLSTTTYVLPDSLQNPNDGSILWKLGWGL